MHITFTLNLQLATHWKENMYTIGLRSSRVGSFLVWSLVGGNTKRKRTDQKRTGSVRVESFLFWWKRALREAKIPFSRPMKIVHSHYTVHVFTKNVHAQWH